MEPSLSFNVPTCTNSPKGFITMHLAGGLCLHLRSNLMELKRYSYEDEILGNIPISAELQYREKDSDYSWYKVLTKEELKRIAKYYDLDQDLIDLIDEDK